MWHGDDGKFVKKGTAGNHVDKDIDTLKAELIENISSSRYTVIDPGDEADLPAYWLPPKEYAMVMSNLATNLTKEEYKAGFATRDIRNNRYYVLIHGFNDYVIIDKTNIKAKRGKK
jgi:hypothetical protein